MSINSFPINGGAINDTALRLPLSFDMDLSDALVVDDSIINQLRLDLVEAPIVSAAMSEISNLHGGFSSSLVANDTVRNAFSGGYAGAYSESLSVSEAIKLVFALSSTNSLSLLSSLDTKGTFTFPVLSSIATIGESTLSFAGNFSEDVTTAGDATSTRESVIELIESLVATGAVTTLLHGMYALSEAIVVSEQLSPGIGSRFIESTLEVNTSSALSISASFLEALAATGQAGILFRASMPVSEALALTALHDIGFDAVFAEALGVSGTAFLGLVAAFSEALSIETASDSIHHADVSLTESLKEVASSVLGLHADFDASAAISDNSVIAIASLFLETLSEEDQLDTLLHANLSAAEALVLTALHKVGSDADLTEAMIVGDGITLDSNMVLALLETLVLGETPELSAKILCPISETLVETTGVTTQASLYTALIEGLEIGGVLNTPEGVFEAWVVNAETKAPWQYDNYPFNSFAFAGNKYLALTDSGLYELTGSDDDGTNIDTVIRTGLENFNSNQKKSIPWAYFGYTSSGRLLFKTITTATGKKVENWYELEARTADDDTETRVNIGRGLRSVYWQFELTNIDGAEFEFDDIQLMPARLKRRL